VPLLRSPLWEEQFGQSRQAFAAFVLYRDLGSRRTVLAAYRCVERNASAKRASGRWIAWSSHWRW
jgi:hypothetical protein